MYLEAEDSTDFVQARENYRSVFAQSFVHLTGLSVTTENAEGFLRNMKLANRMAVIRAREEDELVPLPLDNIIQTFLDSCYRQRVHTKRISFTQAGLALVSEAIDLENNMENQNIYTEGLGETSNVLDLDIITGSANLEIRDRDYLVAGYASNEVVYSAMEMLKSITLRSKTNIEILQIPNCPPIRKTLD